MNDRVKILVVDDEPVICKSCVEILSEYNIETLQSSRIALEKIRVEFFDLIIIDLKMPGINGFELLKLIKKINPEVIVIIITAYSTIESVVETMRFGAFDYLPKPFTPDELSIKVEKALEKRKLIMSDYFFSEDAGEKYKYFEIIGKSKKMQNIYKIIEKVALSDSTVLIYGESGSGKELIAHAIHNKSNRKEKSFISLDCSTLTETLLESELFGYVKGAFTGAVVTKPGFFEVACQWRNIFFR